MFDKPDPKLIMKANEMGIEVFELRELEELGQRVAKPSPDQVTICRASQTYVL